MLHWVLHRRLSEWERCASPDAILLGSRSLLVCERLVEERLVNVHWQVALCSAMGAVSVRLMV